MQGYTIGIIEYYQGRLVSAEWDLADVTQSQIEAVRVRYGERVQFPIDGDRRSVIEIVSD